ncbi:lycopene cyclase [Nocardiaceae bacterium YC2-7]|uniref:Lycopene cyclase n=1 Tax=Antrihabitans stalactiti TaxID=2584121 RepID=A0A848K4D1_9NOCA|nr:lycopene cyclase family protein [Antrihabitans stalactiti]NMN93491.1 lycopene cyclase [Antrihabitans stalactiti]
MTAEVLVLGLGPAGRALTHRLSVHSIDVRAVDPHPRRTWTPTYAAWRDELPGWLPDSVIGAVVDRPEAWTTKRQLIGRPYAVLDTAALQAALTIDPGAVIEGTVVEAMRDRVVLADGTMLHAQTVIDARGAVRGPRTAEQTAFGYVVGAEAARSVLDGADAWFMDWRTDNGTTRHDSPSFLYAVPLSRNEFLVEETCLVGRPGLSQRVLQSRLDARLRSRGVDLSGNERIERVRFPVDGRRRRPLSRQPVAFGARGATMHPGTGYSVATSLSLADVLAHSLDRPNRALWPAQAVSVDILRRAGLRTLLNLAPDQVSPFFEAFFDLPTPLQRAYLSDRSDLRGTMRAMLTQFARLPRELQIVTAKSASVPGVRSHFRSNSTIMGE